MNFLKRFFRRRQIKQGEPLVVKHYDAPTTIITLNQAEPLETGDHVVIFTKTPGEPLRPEDYTGIFTEKDEKRQSAEEIR